MATPSLYFGFRGGYYKSDIYNDGVPDEVRYLYSRGNVGQAGVPASFQHAANFSNVFTNTSTVRDEQTRAFFQTDATFYVNAAGQHTFKGGVQVDRVGNDVLTRRTEEPGPPAVGHRPQRPARRLRLLPGAQQRRRPGARAS